jgi:hypothetical protein
MIKFSSIVYLSRRRSRGLLGIMVLLFVVAGCATQDPFAPLPTPTPTGEVFLGPPPPLAPEGVGTGLGEPRSLIDILDVVSCLADGQPAYALLQNNANVLTSPAEDSCQIGRAASGALVRIEGVYRDGETTPWVTLDRRQRLDGLTITGPVGYVEDIQPIFEQVCASCHGGAVKTLDLQVTDYDALMKGSLRGTVVTPGDPEASKLWTQIESGAMPLIGELAPEQKRLVYEWVLAGAPEERPTAPEPGDLWLQISQSDFVAANNNCQVNGSEPHTFIRADLAHIASCAAAPTAEQIAQLRPSARPATQTASLQSDVSPVDVEAAPEAPDAVDVAAAEEEVEATTDEADTVEAVVEAAAVPAPRLAAPGQARIGAAPLGLSAPADSDPWMIGRGGFCVEQRLQQKLEKTSGITSLAFAPDGRLFIGLDSPSTGDSDPNILFDAFHPSRSVVVYNTASADEFYTPILQESSRVTGLVWYNGAVYLNRAGEVGRIVDGGTYERLASGFAVNGRLFHANNGIAVVNGWLYVSAGGVRDGYSDGIINPGDGDVSAETQAVNIAGGGNAFAARLVRAPIDRLVSERNIGVFQTAARGFRNPYGITADPSGRLWITDNGATNVGEEYFAGDEINLFDPAQAGSNEAETPFYGFPIALSGTWKDWWTAPVLPLINTSAPTGITWAYGTIFYAQYGRNPGLYRLASAGGQIIAERVLLGWPIQAVTTAPDGAIWIGTGNGGLYRLTPGC